MTNYSNIRYASSGTTVYADMSALIAATGSDGDQALVQSNNNIYVYSGTGWYKIATVQNDSPSAITGVNGTYALAIDGTATTITAVSTDPEGFPLTWSYSASGLGSIATISQADNVFTITPSTNSANAGTFSLTINATDGINGAVSTSTNLTLEFIVIVTDSKYTTLLATATDTSDNNNITDSSSNNHSITVNGDAHAGTFSPYRSGGYSILFDNTTGGYSGSGTYSIRYAEGTTSDFNMGTNAFTIEGWIKPYDTGSGSRRFYQNRYSSTGNGKGSIFQNGSNLYMSYRGDDGTNYELGPYSVLSENTWTHFCLLRNTTDNTLKLYADGTLLGSVSVPSNVGIYNSGSNTYIGSGFGGEMANIRVINGTAVAPPAGGPTEKPENVTNTVLLLNGPNLVDYSGIAPIHNDPYNYDTPTVKVSSPLDNIEYSAADHGGSVYFDGTGDYLTTTSSNYSLGSSSAFTFEFWYRFDDFLSSPATIFDYYDGSGNNINKLAVTSSNVYLYNAQANANILAYAFEHQANIWYHFCWTRDASNNHVFYINGQQVGTSTSSTNLNGEILDFGRRAGTYNNTFMKGHLSDISLIKGSVTRTSNFTPPTAPLSSSGTELHIKGTDASIIDKSQSSNLKLVGNTTGSTTQAKFSNTKSMYFDGSGDRATATGVTDLGDDFTIECWVYSTATGNRGIVSSIDNVGNWGNNGYWSFGIYGGNPQLQIDGGSYSGASTSLSANQWVHIAVTRTSNTIRYFINGTRDSTTFSNSLTLKNPSGIVIGSSPNNNYIYNYTGYIQDLRIANECKYTAADESANIPTAPLEG